MSETVNEVIGRRLRESREKLGLTLRQVSEMLDFNNYQVLAEIEKGRRALKAVELAQLSRIYVKNTWFFLQEEEVVSTPPVFAWRARAELSDTKAAEAQFEQALNNYQLLEDLVGESKAVDLEPWQINDASLSREDIEQLAESLSEKLQLGYRPAVNLVEAVEKSLHAKVMHLELDGHGSAVSTYGDFGYGIIIDRCEAPWRRNFSLAHELFHLLARSVYPIEDLHKGSASANRKVERDADTFAAALLMPRGPVLSAVKDHSSDNKIESKDLVRIAIEFCVSTQALLYRLSNLGLIPRDTVSDLLGSPEFNCENQGERDGSNNPARMYSDRFVGLGVRALKDGRISKRKFCEIFGIRTSDFGGFVRNYIFMDDLEDDLTYELNYS